MHSTIWKTSFSARDELLVLVVAGGVPVSGVFFLPMLVPGPERFRSTRPSCLLEPVEPIDDSSFCHVGRFLSDEERGVSSETRVARALCAERIPIAVESFMMLE